MINFVYLYFQEKNKPEADFLQFLIFLPTGKEKGLTCSS